jgi:hypothetical protein
MDEMDGNLNLNWVTGMAGKGGRKVRWLWVVGKGGVAGRSEFENLQSQQK